MIASRRNGFGLDPRTDAANTVRLEPFGWNTRALATLGLIRLWNGPHRPVPLWWNWPYRVPNPMTTAGFPRMVKFLT